MPRRAFKLTPRKPLKLKEWLPAEEDEQRAIMDPEKGWAVLNRHRWPELSLLFASMNGILTNAQTGAKMVRLGRRSGVPDLCLPVPRNGFHSLWIELKRAKGGVVSDNQTWWHINLRENGHRVEVCKGADEAIRVITEYLEG